MVEDSYGSVGCCSGRMQPELQALGLKAQRLPFSMVFLIRISISF